MVFHKILYEIDNNNIYYSNINWHFPGPSDRRFGRFGRKTEHLILIRKLKSPCDEFQAAYYGDRMAHDIVIV